MPCMLEQLNNSSERQDGTVQAGCAVDCVLHMCECVLLLACLQTMLATCPVTVIYGGTGLLGHIMPRLILDEM